MKTVGVVNQKGGTGKTTTARETAAMLAARGLNVIAIDLDSQADLTTFFLDDERPAATIRDVLERHQAATDATVPTGRDGLDLLPADSDVMDMATARVMAADARAALAQLAVRYDIAVIDFPRSASTLAVSFLALCDVVVIPTEPGRASVEKAMGVIRLLALMDQPPTAAILMTRYNARTRVAREYAEIITDYADGHGATVFDTRIPMATAIPEADGYGMTLSEYGAKLRPTSAYSDYVSELNTLLKLA